MQINSPVMQLKGIAPTVKYRDAFLEMLSDFETNDPANAELYVPAKGEFSAYVQNLLDQEHGLNLPDGWAPCAHRWLVTDRGTLAGVTRIRHNIDTPFLFHDGGHIGYDITPRERCKGFGHLALRIALGEANALGLERALLLTAEDNAASRAVIERQGGALETIVFSEFWQERLCRYWISLRSKG